MAIHPEGAISGGYGIMSLDIIPARSEAEWPSSPEGAISEGYGIMSSDIIPARSAFWEKRTARFAAL